MFPTTPITVCFPNGHYTSKYVFLKSPHAAADTQKCLARKGFFKIFSDLQKNHDWAPSKFWLKTSDDNNDGKLHIICLLIYLFSFVFFLFCFSKNPEKMFGTIPQ